MHLNKDVYKVDFRAQDVSYIRELRYEIALSATNSLSDINITKSELTSDRSGSYGCSMSPTADQTNTTKKVYTITCRAVDDGYNTYADNN